MWKRQRSTKENINNIIGETLICPGEEYFYVADPSNDNSSTQSIYNWTITGGSPSSWSGDDCFITWNTTGPYSIDVTNTTSNGCQSPPFTKIINEHSGNFSIKNITSGSGTIVKISFPKINA